MNLEALLANLPLTHLSYSAIRTFTEDPRNFKKKYIDHIYDDKTPLPMAIGSAYHQGIETYLKSKPTKGKNELGESEAIAEAAKYLVDNEDKIEFGKKRIAKKAIEEYERFECSIIEDESSGKKVYYAKLNVQTVIADVTRYLEHYFSLDLGYTPIEIEQSLISHTIDFETKTAQALPIKGRIDLIAKDKAKKRVCTDHKLMGTKPKTDEEGEYIAEPGMRMQAACYESMLEIKPDYFSFDVMVKGTTPSFHQVQFELTDTDRIAWSRLLKGTIYKLIAATMFDDVEICFTPNPWHMFQKDGWLEFLTDMEYRLQGDDREVKQGKEDEDYEAIDL